MRIMSFGSIVAQGVVFLSVYVQLFLLVTFLEKRKELHKEHKLHEDAIKLSSYPTVEVIVPAWNEGTTVHGTVESLLALDYPADKLSLILVDDGSTDNTWKEMQRYDRHPRVRIFQKENGGKHTAVNYGIDRSHAQFISCLDADSFVARDALKRIMHTFEIHPQVMAVAPSIIIHKPKTLIQYLQKVEYNMSLYIKKMLSFMNAIHVTPGPFSVFRREVFEKIGQFRKAHNTEDAEIAFRMQTNHMKIEHCHLAHVYTVAPDTVRKLFKQRLRWIYGFIQNVIDYRRVIFSRKYGNFSMFTIPSGVISILTIIYIFLSLIFHLVTNLYDKAVQIHTVGWAASFHAPQFELFFLNTKTTMIVSIALYTFLLVAIVQGHRLAKDKRPINKYLIPYMIIYSLITPLWLMKAVWNSVTARKPSWR